MFRLFFLSLIIVMCVACQPTLTPSSVAVNASPTPIATTTIEPTPTATSTPEVLSDQPTALRIWTTEQVSPLAPGQSGDYFSRMLRTFEQTYEYEVEDPVIKKTTGKGGILNFLRTSKSVAPSILPDIAIIKATSLTQATEEQLIVPLDDLFNREIIQDLLPVARKIGTVNDQLMGIPLALDTQHLIYNTDVLTKTELLWSDILTNNINYAFSVYGDNGLVDDATLSHYFSVGGKLNKDLITPHLDGSSLEQVLTLYQQGIESGAINQDISLNKSNSEILSAYLDDEINVTNITVSQFLQNEQTLKNHDVAALPLATVDNNPVPVTHGWVVVLVTDDPERQEGAIKLMEWFLSTDNNARWNSLNYSIPTRDSTYQELAEESFYWQFLANLLNTAEPYPSFNGYDVVGHAMHQAVQQVMNVTASPNEATTAALDALTN